MKSTTFIGILLTFLMAILVLASAIVFLWQGRQQMHDQIAGLETEVAMLSDAQIRAEANLAAESAARATAQADLSTRQAEFDRSEQESIALQQEVAALASQLTRVSMTVTVTPDPAALDAPRLYLFLEPAGTVPINSIVDYTIIIGHPAGIARGTIFVNNEVFNNFQANGLLLVPLEGSFEADTPGEISFRVVATSTLGVSGTTTATLTVLAPTPTATPTPSETPSPTPTAPETPAATNTPTALNSLVPLKTGRNPALAVGSILLPGAGFVPDIGG